MIKSIICLLLLLNTATVWAQESYFNVPESEVVEGRKLTVQQQFSLQNTYQSLTTIDYGLGKDWEIGVNLLNLNYDPSQRRFVRTDSISERAYGPLLLLNGQKIFDLPGEFHLGIGGQLGGNLTPETRRRRLVSYGYVNLNKELDDDRYKLTVGTYAGNAGYVGGGRNAAPPALGKALIGLQAGFEAGIIDKKLYLIGDWISGPYAVGQSVLGLEVFLSKSLPLAIGWQRTNLGGSSGLVVQLTYSPE